MILGQHFHFNSSLMEIIQLNGIMHVNYSLPDTHYMKYLFNYYNRIFYRDYLYLIHELKYDTYLLHCSYLVSIIMIIQVLFI